LEPELDTYQFSLPESLPEFETQYTSASNRPLRICRNEIHKC
jgi:hypothetical protein